MAFISFEERRRRLLSEDVFNATVDAMGGRKSLAARESARMVLVGGESTYLAAETVYQDVKSQGNVYRKSAAIRKAAKALRDALEPGGVPVPVFLGGDRLMRAAVFDAIVGVSSSQARGAIVAAARAALVDGLTVEAAAEAAYGEPRNIRQVRKKVEKLRDLAVRIEVAFSEKNIK